MSSAFPLSYDLRKIKFYEQDVDYLHSKEIRFQEFCHDPKLAFSRTFLVLQPETLVSGLYNDVVNFVYDVGFDCHAVVGMSFGLPIAKGIWRYQWNAATEERMEFFAVKASMEQSLVLLLSRKWEDTHLPASTFLHTLKGSSKFPDERKEGQLRTLLPFSNRAMTFVHCPDEPIDVVREIGVLGPSIEHAQIQSWLRPAILCKDEVVSQICANKSGTFFDNFSTLEANDLKLWHAHLEAKRTGSPSELTSLGKRFAWEKLASISHQIEYDKTAHEPLVSTRAMPGAIRKWTNQLGDV